MRGEKLTAEAEQRLGTLYRSEYRSIRRYFRKRLGENEAEDAAALVFVRLARAYDAGRDPDLGLIVNAVAVDEMRARRYRPSSYGLKPGEIEEPVLYVVEPETSPRRSFRAAFDTALRGLPGAERDAFILIELRGLTSREAAGVLDTSHMTIHRRAESARLTVAKEIT